MAGEFEIELQQNVKWSRSQTKFSLYDNAKTKTRGEMVRWGIYFCLPKVFLLSDILTVLAVPATGQEGKKQAPNVENTLLNKMDAKKKTQEAAKSDRWSTSLEKECSDDTGERVSEGAMFRTHSL